jgi:hypothetical protein
LKRRLVHAFRSGVSQLVSFTKAAAVVGGVLLVVASDVPWLNDPLKRLGFDDLNGVGAGVIVFILSLIFFDVRSLAGRGLASDGVQHFADPMDVYPVLIERMKAVRRREDKVLDVLGMTLYTAWPTITFWLNRPDLRGWTVRLCAVTERTEELERTVPSDWFEESRANLAGVIQKRDTLKRQGQDILLEAYGYDFTPVIHGFRLANGDLFFSVLAWQQDGKIGRESYSYHFLPLEDRSESANAIREVFDSWFRRACLRPWPASCENPPDINSHTESRSAPG